MDDLFALLDAFGDDPVVTAAALVVAGAAVGLVAIAGLLHQRRGIRRRATAGAQSNRPAGAERPPNPSLQRLAAFLEANLSGDAKENRILRGLLVQAGFYEPQAVALYFAARLVGAVGLGFAGAMVLPLVLTGGGSNVWIWSLALAIGGYFLPTLALKRRIKQRAQQHRLGFPDFMDLMVVCAEAGLAMEAAIERISRELVDGYPSLAENLTIVSLEIRAGKTFADALERLGHRLAIEEASMLASLLQQSAELGTSLSASLRVYSDEMRHKRMSRAEEKAYALPAKLVVPLILFIFPVLIFVLMLPVVIRISSIQF